VQNRDDIEWQVSPGLTDYADALAAMEARAARQPAKFG
jgi:lipoyl(octanoyl) transferase